MSDKITVTVRSDRGDLGTHLKYGRLIPGATMIIDAADYGSELFKPLPDAPLSADLSAKASATAEAKAKAPGKAKEVKPHA